VVSYEVLEKVEAFSDFIDEQLSKLQNLCEELEFQRDDKLFTEGDPAMHLWQVVEGEVDLRFEMPDKRQTTNRQTVSSVEVKHKDPVAQTLRWSCFVPPYKMRLSAYCVTRKCRIIRFRKEDLLRLFESDPLMGYRFMSYMITVVGYRFHEFQDVVAKTMGESMLSGW
jgi:CRP-like cAMP-binding protein